MARLRITRVGFCAECARNYRPVTDQYFIAYGSTHQKKYYYQAQRVGMYGFTPHIYECQIVGNNLDKPDSCNVIVYKTCSMLLCGYDYVEKYNQKTHIIEWDYEVKHWTKEVWTLSQWFSLVEYRRDLDYHI